MFDDPYIIPPQHCGPAWAMRLYLAYDRLRLKLRWRRYRRSRDRSASFR
jgi:hypothetical protein